MREQGAWSMEHGELEPETGGFGRESVGRMAGGLRHKPATAFTLIELLVVVAIIAILAALALGTLGYVNKKGSDSRARAELAALSSAIESFKLETGAFPADAQSLFTNLCSTAAGSKVYFEPTPGMLRTNGALIEFIDPWGNAYGYSNNTTYFELWSTAGVTDTNQWLRF